MSAVGRLDRRIAGDTVWNLAARATSPAAGLVLGASWLWLGYRGGVLLHRAPAA